MRFLRTLRWEAYPGLSGSKVITRVLKKWKREAKEVRDGVVTMEVGLE